MLEPDLLPSSQASESHDKGGFFDVALGDGAHGDNVPPREQN